MFGPAPWKAASMLPLMLFRRSVHGWPSTSILQFEEPLTCRWSALCEITQNVSARVFVKVHVNTTVLELSAGFSPRCCDGQCQYVTPMQNMPKKQRCERRQRTARAKC